MTHSRVQAWKSPTHLCQTHRSKGAKEGWVHIGFFLSFCLELVPMDPCRFLPGLPQGSCCFVLRNSAISRLSLPSLLHIWPWSSVWHSPYQFFTVTRGLLGKVGPHRHLCGWGWSVNGWLSTNAWWKDIQVRGCVDILLAFTAPGVLGLRIL